MLHPLTSSPIEMARLIEVAGVNLQLAMLRLTTLQLTMSQLATSQHRQP